AQAGEYRQPRVLCGDVVDELQHRHRLANPCATEETDLAALGERADEVDHLDARLEQLDRGRELVEPGRGGVDRQAVLGLHRATLVDLPAEDVYDAFERVGPYR